MNILCVSGGIISGVGRFVPVNPFSFGMPRRRREIFANMPSCRGIPIGRSMVLLKYTLHAAPQARIFLKTESLISDFPIGKSECMPRRRRENFANRGLLVVIFQ